VSEFHIPGVLWPLASHHLRRAPLVRKVGLKRPNHRAQTWSSEPFADLVMGKPSWWNPIPESVIALLQYSLIRTSVITCNQTAICHTFHLNFQDISQTPAYSLIPDPRTIQRMSDYASSTPIIGRLCNTISNSLDFNSSSICLERLDIKAYVGAAWEAFHKNSFKEKGEQTWYAEFKWLSLPQSLFFTPDMTLENPEILFCLLLKRIFSDEKGPRFIDNHTVLSRTAVTD
jgi:hypothetical protein